ncbi:MAG: helix-turn-helix transcriptional regulator [Chloroflexota bacterium]
MNQVDLDRHHELAEFLRNRRARLSPEQVGLPHGTRRRTPGLRREEVAMLAGVSPEWYTWLEQGRDINVSMQVLDSLARALQLDANERQHLYLLVLRQMPPVETYSPPTVSPTIQGFLDTLSTSPACVVDARTNVIGWNAAYYAAFGDFSALPECERNLIWRIFMLPGARKANEHWREMAQVLLAQFRASYGRFINDPWWAEQIAKLSEASPEFRELWALHDVLNRSEGQKTIRHPLVGELEFDILWLQTVNSDDLHLLIHTPCIGSGTAEKVAQLVALAAEKNLQTLEGILSV